MIKKLAAPVGAAAVMFSIAAGTVAPASAANNIKPFGTQETLKYDHGLVEVGYTAAGLSPSTDTVPYPVSGQLYESMVTVDAVQGWVTPLVPFFNARAESGQNYRVIANVWTPEGLSGATLPPGGSSSGKVYFDVVGDVPNSVVFNDGVQDLLAWVP
jgi:hypothetical protein